MSPSTELTFTVFTATFNRAHTLIRVYESLRAQTYRDFEWLIVDDGSRDDTRAVVERWRAEADFPIRYVYQENQGKHVAHNLAVALAQGRFFLPLDSDDACVPEALERLHDHWETIPDDQRDHFSGVTALCRDQMGALVGSEFPLQVTDSDSLECHYKFRVRGEKWGFNRTAVLRQFPMPELAEGMTHVPEGLTWWKMARHYKTRYINDVLRIYFVGDHSLSTPRRPEDVAASLEVQCRVELNDNIDYVRFAPLTFLKSAANYVRFSLHLGRSPAAQWRGLTNGVGQGLWLLALPVGVAAYLRDRMM